MGKQLSSKCWINTGEAVKSVKKWASKPKPQAARDQTCAGEYPLSHFHGLMWLINKVITTGLLFILWYWKLLAPSKVIKSAFNLKAWQWMQLLTYVWWTIRSIKEVQTWFKRTVSHKSKEVISNLTPTTEKIPWLVYISCFPISLLSLLLFSQLFQCLRP